MALLEIKNLTAGIEEGEILHGVDLSVNPGETHVLMGPNVQYHFRIDHPGRRGYYENDSQ